MVVKEEEEKEVVVVRSAGAGNGLGRSQCQTEVVRASGGAHHAVRAISVADRGRRMALCAPQEGGKVCYLMVSRAGLPRFIISQRRQPACMHNPSRSCIPCADRARTADISRRRARGKEEDRRCLGGESGRVASRNHVMAACLAAASRGPAHRPPPPPPPPPPLRSSSAPATFSARRPCPAHHMRRPRPAPTTRPSRRPR